MRQFHTLLKAFDAEVARLSEGAGKEKKALVAKIAGPLRRGLVQFYDTHGRLPKTTQELVHSEFSLPEFRRMYPCDPPILLQHGVPPLRVKIFLRETQDIVDDIKNARPNVRIAASLIHSVYRAEDRASYWRAAAKRLTECGFTADQVRLLRTSTKVRKACRKLLRPFDP